MQKKSKVLKTVIFFVTKYCYFNKNKIQKEEEN